MVDARTSGEVASDAELASMQEQLNEFEPKDVHAALMALPAAGATGVIASGPLDFGSVPAGVLVYRSADATFRIRVTVTDMAGGTYDELELDGPRLREVVASVKSVLERQNAPRAHPST